MRAWLLVVGAVTGCKGDGKVKPDAFVAPTLTLNLANPVVALAQSIPPTSKNGDCLCFAATNCGLPSAACTIGGPGTPVDTAHACTGEPATQDEMSALVAILGTAH